MATALYLSNLTRYTLPFDIDQPTFDWLAGFFLSNLFIFVLILKHVNIFPLFSYYILMLIQIRLFAQCAHDFVL